VNTSSSGPSMDIAKQTKIKAKAKWKTTLNKPTTWRTSVT